MRLTTTALCAALTALSSACQTPIGQADSPAPIAADQSASNDLVSVMVLGTYHMAGSTSDVVNVEVDNVLTAHRQRELEVLATSLATFDPTMVVTERVTEAPDYIDPYYTDFTLEDLEKTPNERVQVAFRVARKVGLEEVHGIDEQADETEPDYFPLGAVMEHAANTGQSDRLNQEIAELRAVIEKSSADSKADSIAQQLFSYNTGKLADLNKEFYFRLSKYDVGEAQPAAELQAYWFMRNAKIFSKILDVAEPGDRVLVVYGAGHKYWLEAMAKETPGVELVDPIPFLEAAIAQQ